MSKDYKKLYEDVVALAKDGLTDGLYLSRSAKDVTEFLFPQLKKSENEKISKKLIQLLQNGGRLPDEEHKQALSWLEKQSKIKLTHYDSAEKEKSDFVNGQFIQCRKSFNEFKENESYLFEYIGDDTYIGKSDNVLDEEFYITPQQLFTLFTHEHCPKDYEKQDEQKLVDEYEPKFKVGDWITNDEYTWKVTAIQPLDYIIQSQNGNTVDDTISYVDEHFHLWTIQDAKDGDVLKEDSCMFIVEKMKSEGTAIIYCCLFDDGDFDLIGSTLSFDVDSTYPATKEQRNLLFQKMKEEGYEWDVDKKELKKIEKRQDWNEENERIRKELIEFIRHGNCVFDSLEQKNRFWAWLEKQGETSFDEEWIKLLKNANIQYQISINEDMVDNAAKLAVDGLKKLKIYEIVERYVYKQGEENKSVGNVEPKFKIGDWVVYNNANVYQVKKIDYTNIIPRYELENIGGDKLSIPFTADYNLRSWTIQDAKKGDVLYCKKDDDLEIIVMYLGINRHNNVDSYCRYNSKLGFNTYITNVLNAEFDFITPATKEQRNILLSKMKETGYEWDAEKKEFGKIEQGCYHNDGLYYAIDILEKTFGKVEGYQSDDGKMEHQNAIETVNSLYHKKPNVWSEEDEKMLSKLIKHFEWKDTEYRFTKEDCLEATNWLKSLKPHWKPSEYDISLLEEIARNIRNNVRPFCSEVSSLEDLIKNLKTL